jgi:hypothetical protein
MPATGRAVKNGIGIGKHDNQQSFLIKFDKSITENINGQNVPDIKFAGTPFIFFFCSFFLTLSTLKTGLSINYPVFKNEECIRLCILRL